MSRCRRVITLAVVALVMAFLTAPPANPQGATIIAADNFNRADEIPYSTTGNWGRVIAGNYDGVSHLVDNQVTSVSNEGIYYWKGSGTFDPTRQFARQRVVQKDGELGLVLLGGPDHAIMMQWGPPGVGNTLYIYWYSDGQDQAVLSQTPATINNGDIIEGVLDGGIIYAKVNGAVVASVANTTTLTTGTPGFITYLNPSLPTQVSILDDWEAGTPASYTISGTITEDSAGLSGVLVTASGDFSGSATTDGSGDYTITGITTDTGTVVLTPTLSGHTFTPTTRTVPGPIVADVTDQDFTASDLTGAVLTVHATHGTVTRDPDLPQYTVGSNVTLTPIPAPGYSFGSWSGNVPVGDELDNPLVLTMDNHKEVTAHFLAEGLIASDHFNRGNEAPLTVGGNWQQPVGGGSVNLINNEIAGNSGEALYSWSGPGTFDNARQFARSTVVQAGGQVGLVLLGGPGQAYVIAWGGGRLYFYWYSGGSYQGELANVASTLQNGDQIEAVLDQGRVFAKRNGVVVHSTPNTTSLSTGKPGFETFLSGAIVDDWEAGTPPEFSISGTITENAAGLSGVLVTASGSISGTTTTDGNGAYSFTDVPFGAMSIVLTPTLSGHTMSPPSRTVVGPLTADVTGQDFTGTLVGDPTLTVNATNGTVIKNPDQPSYVFGTIVTLTPVPDAGYVFAGWIGDVPVGDELDNPLQVTMNQNRVITATFVINGAEASDNFNRADETPLVTGGIWQQIIGGGSANLTNQELAGASGEAAYFWQGPGTFSGSRQFARATVVQAGGQLGLVLFGGTGHGVVVSWSGGQVFVYWYASGAYQGQLTSTASPLQNGDQIEAIVDQGRIFAKRNGIVVLNIPNTTSLSAGKPGLETFLAGAVIDDWEAGTPPTYTISGTITENANGLSGVQVAASGSFTGTTTTDANGNYSFSSVPFGATSVVLTPTLTEYVFTPANRTVTGPLTADVEGQDFAGTQNTGAVLTINAVNGTVTRDPDLPVYPFGTVVTLTPVPSGGFAFSGWSGDVPPGDELDNPLQVTMNADRTLVANFVAQGLIAADDFNRANEVPFATGLNWQKATGAGSANLTSQQVAGATSEAVYFWQGPGVFNNARQFARATVVNAGGQLGLVLLGGTGRGIVVAWSGGQLFVYSYLGGSYQGELTRISSPLQNGDQIEAVLDQGRIFAKRNGVVVLNIANSTSLTTGTPGFETFQSGAVIDNWEAGTPPSYTISGTITEDAVGLSGVQVTASGSFSGSTTTDANGNYALSSVPFGAMATVVTPTLSGYSFSPVNRTVNGPLTADVAAQDFAATSSSVSFLTVHAVHGTVTKNPDLAFYPTGSNVTLTPAADPGYHFVRWLGDVPPGDETDNPLVLTMSQSRTVTAVFIGNDALAWDTFNRANEAPFAVGGNWAKATGAGVSNLTGQQVVGAPSEAVYFWQGAGTFDGTTQFARSTVTNPGGQIGLVLLGGPGRAIVVAWNGGGTLFIYWYTGNTYQGNLTTAASSVQAGNRIEARLENGTISARINGVVVASVANTTGLPAGTPGFETFQTGGAFDDWEAGPTPSNCAGLPDGTACDDGDNSCTSTDTCQGGVCVGTPISCDDANPCTVDSCTPGVGCQSAPGNAGAVCRSAVDGCDAAETCTGSSATCPADQQSPALGVACDGADSDLCIEGVTICSAGTIVCGDTTGDNLDVCNGLDDDCDPGSADGTEDPALGVACDGTDTDLCNEGVTVCTAGALACNDATGNNLDVCNGSDDDCDPASADGAEDPGVGLACDGTDSDLCNEGVSACTDGTVTCTDTTGSTVDLCNGVDDDCDPASADGSEDPAVGVACDGTDSDLCNEGTTACTAGAITCGDTTGDNLDVCNGTDDDCDPASADGSEDPAVGVACDGTDSDLCNEGVSACTDGAVTCTDTTGSTVDLCNGVDDDCDPASADGSEDPTVGIACDGTDSDLCNEGVTVCTGGTVSCNDTTGDNLDVCNGLDDDCDPASADGSEDPTVGVACDGTDSDLCNEGATVCTGGTVTCNDATGDNLDVCNGLDDDCDPASVDGSEDPTVGVSCDGTDSDLCNEGATVCTGGTVTCNDTTGDNLDVCNGLDDDCDPASADGAEDAGVGLACDGTDSDLCNEGTTVCTAGAIACSDTTGNNLDVCNGLDDDCDPASTDGSEDPTVGVACDGTDSDLCNEGATVCTGGTVSCTDTTGSTVDVCNGVDDDCDPASADGAEDSGVGLACDGTDSDLCNEGATVCTGGSISCNDTTGSNLDVCNGLDDDCDPASADGSEDPTVGVACDGTDSDLCNEGLTVCTGGTVSCTDTTGSTVDVCNGVDDDCDPASVDGAEDPLVGVACDGPDGDLCIEGATVCAAGAVACADATGTTVEACNGLDDDCNGVTDDNGLALCDDGNSCNGTEVCSGAVGCQAGTPPAVASRVSIPDTITALAGGTLVAPVLADVATGTVIQLVVTYDAAVLQPLGVDKSLITASATVTPNLAVSGQVQVSISAPAPLQGSGALVYVRFQVLGAVGSSATLGLPQVTIDGGLVSSCHDPGQAGFCSTASQEVTGLTVSAKTNTILSWTKIQGGGHRYDLASGTIADLRGDRSPLDAACVVDSITQDATNDTRPNPAVGAGYYYLVRMQDACAKGTYGNSSRGDERWAAAACP